MGSRYMPSRPRRDERPRHGRDDDYDPYDRYDRNERYDRYGDRYGSNERFRSPPPPRSPPRRRYDDYGAQDPGYTFRGAATRNDDRPPPDHFSFRASGPRFPSPDHYTPPPAPRGPARGGRRGDLSGRGGRGRGRGQYGQLNGRPPWRRAPPPSERDILHKTGRAATPEQLEGMNADGQVRFNALESSSEESDDELAARPTSSSEEEGEIRRKRFKVDAPQPKLDAPKWSNPDPYSVLPPTETNGAAKRDIVAQIRKAKNDVKAGQDMNQAINQNSDFISFNFDEDMDDDKASVGQSEARDDYHSELSSVRSAPTSHAPNGNGAPALQPKHPERDEAKTFARGPPIDLTGDDGDEDMAPPPPKRTLRGQAQPPIYLTAGDDAPPPPPTGFVMPTDEELMQQYIGQPTKGRKRKHEEQSRGKGDIVDAWVANWSEPTPWCTTDRSQTNDVSLRLHEEITDFFEFVRPHQYEEAIRHELILRVQSAVNSMGGGSKDVAIKCFGSFAAGLYLPTADMDLVAVSQEFLSRGRRRFCQTGTQMHKLARHLTATGIAQGGTVTAVTRAKVPIVKFTDRDTGIKVDISFENDSGLKANETFQEWKVDFPTMPVLVVLIKQLLAMRDLNEVFTGGLGGFSIICLVVSMLQLMPDDEYDDLRRDGSYGALLLKFLDLYGNEFDLRGTGIEMNPPGYYDKIRHPMQGQNANNLTIIDPNRPDNDISGGSREVHAVFEVFRKAHSQILQRMEKVEGGKDVDKSILGCVLGGNYSSFIRQRNRLYSLYSGESVSPPPPEPMHDSRPRPQKPTKAKKPIDLARERKRKHSIDDNDESAPPRRPLESRMQGGPTVNTGGYAAPPPPKQRRIEVDPADSERARMLKRQFPQLAGDIPQGMSREEFKRFKKENENSGPGPEMRVGNGATRGFVQSTLDFDKPSAGTDRPTDDDTVHSDDGDDDNYVPPPHVHGSASTSGNGHPQIRQYMAKATGYVPANDKNKRRRDRFVQANPDLVWLDFPAALTPAQGNMLGKMQRSIRFKQRNPVFPSKEVPDELSHSEVKELGKLVREGLTLKEAVTGRR